VAVRIEDIIQRIRRGITEDATGPSDVSPADLDGLPAISSRPELDYLNRNWQLFDPLSEMRSHRRLLGPLVVRFKWGLRRLVLGVLDRFFERQRFFLLELVRFNNALAERSDRLLREVTERTKAVAERNDLFLGGLDLRLEALEAREQMRRSLTAAPTDTGGLLAAADDEEGVLAEMAVALAPGVAERVRPFVEHFPEAGEVLVLGCGDGEVFEALEGTSAVGVDASAALVAACRARGKGAQLVSLRSHLESVPEGSLGALVCTGFADRHPRAAWPRLIAAAWRSLRPGGVAVFEGLSEARDVARLRWLAARQRFAIVEQRELAPEVLGGAAHVLVARRSQDA
jgi:O-antigen chain-terminating methyltransferase